MLSDGASKDEFLPKSGHRYRKITVIYEGDIFVCHVKKVCVNTCTIFWHMDLADEPVQTKKST